MNVPKDLYLILGVSRDASPSTIRSAYRRLTEEWRAAHADDASEEWEELRHAYETLSDTERRRRYDQRLAALETGHAYAPWTTPLNILRRPVEPATLTGDVLLTPEEARAGGSLPVDVPIDCPCSDCDGTGGYGFDCGRCEGEGRLTRRFPLQLRVPPGVADGAVFHVCTDEPGVCAILLTVSIARR